MTRIARSASASSDYGHHCRTCRGAATPQCMKKYHLDPCEECGIVFQFFSKTGCNTHTYADGYNLKVKKVKCGLPEDQRTLFELQLEERIRGRKAEEATRAAAAAEQAAQQIREAKGSKKNAPPKGSGKRRSHGS